MPAWNRLIKPQPYTRRKLWTQTILIGVAFFGLAHFVFGTEWYVALTGFALYVVGAGYVIRWLFKHRSRVDTSRSANYRR
jgi:hypothetical protein